MTAREDVQFRPLASLIVAEALSWLGTPYRHQGSRKGVGCDCLGLVLGVWRAVYGAEPERPAPYAPDWAEAGQRDLLLEAARRYCAEKPKTALSAGDLVLFRWRPHLPAKHAAIAVEPERFIHAYQGNAIIVSALVPQWRGRVAGVFAFPQIRSGSDTPL